MAEEWSADSEESFWSGKPSLKASGCFLAPPHNGEMSYAFAIEMLKCLDANFHSMVLPLKYQTWFCDCLDTERRGRFRNSSVGVSKYTFLESLSLSLSLSLSPSLYIYIYVYIYVYIPEGSNRFHTRSLGRSWVL